MSRRNSQSVSSECPLQHSQLPALPQPPGTASLSFPTDTKMCDKIIVKSLSHMGFIKAFFYYTTLKRVSYKIQ